MNKLNGKAPPYRPARGFISARVSTDEQAQPGLPSIPDQIAQSRAFAARLGVPIGEGDVYVDDETGQILDRPGLTQALSRLDAYTHAFFYDATRLARRRHVALSIRQTLAAAGVELRLVLGDTAGMDDESKLWLESIQDTASEAELIRTTRRTSNGRRARAQSGLPMRAPRFYKVLRDRRGKSIGYELLPEWRPFLDEMAKLYLAGLPVNEIATRLGINPATGRPWREGYIRHTLDNPLLKGRLEWGWRSGKTVFVVAAQLPPAWDEATCARIEQESARRNALGRARVRQGAALLAGVLRCGHCARYMLGRARKPGRGYDRSYVEYACAYNKYRRYGLVEAAPHEPNHISEIKALKLLREMALELDPPTHRAGLILAAAAQAPPSRDYALAQAEEVARAIAELEEEQTRLKSAAGRAALQAEISRLKAQAITLEQVMLEAGPPLAFDPVEATAALSALRALAASDDWGKDRDALRDAARRTFPGGVFIRHGMIAGPVPLY